MTNILILLDMANLWESCCAQYGKRARVDFQTLVNKSKRSKSDNVRTIAFIANKTNKNQDNLVKKLSEFGFETYVKDIKEDEIANFSFEMEAIFDAAVNDIDLCVVCGAGPNSIPLLDKATAAGKDTLIIGFSGGINKDTACAAENIKLLSKNDIITQ